MDAMIGTYKVCMETSQFVLTHSTGISFILTREEVVGLFDFIEVYRETLMLELADTDPCIEIISLKRDEVPHA